MGLFSDKPYTAITAHVEHVCGRKSSDEDAGDLVELIEAIKIANGPGYTEAGRALRKQLKHGGARQQVRALWLLEMLMDNGGRKMPQLLEDPGLGDQVQAIARGADKPAKLARSVLSSWGKRDDDRLSQWSASGRGRAHAHAHARTPSHAPAHAPSHAPAPAPSRSPSPINIRQGSITSTIATAHTIATRLSEQIITHPNVHESTEGRGYYKQAKEMRKRVLNLIHKDDPEVQEFLDRLLMVNEELVTAIQAFEGARARPPSPRTPPSLRPSPPPSPMRTPRTPRVEPPSEDPFADTNEIQETPLVRPLW